MSNYRIPLEVRPGITHINQLQHEQRLQPSPTCCASSSPGQRSRIRVVYETYEDARFNGYPTSFLKTLVGALAACGLLDLPPHKATRAAGYITTREGLLVLALFEKRLAG